MSAPNIVTEILTLNGNELLQKDPNQFAQLVKLVENNATPEMQIQTSQWGSRIEEPGVWQWLIDWESLDQHKKVQVKSPISSVFKDFVTKFLVDTPQMIHVPFRPVDAYVKAVTAPVTEMAIVRRKTEVDPNVFKDVVDTLLINLESIEGCFGGAWGCGVEDESAIVLLLGWTSIETHLAFGASQQFKTITSSFGGCLAETKMFHVSYQRG